MLGYISNNMQQDFPGWNETCKQVFVCLYRKFMGEISASSFTHRYRDNSIEWNAALSRHVGIVYIK